MPMQEVPLMTRAFIGLGANVGDRLQFLQRAVRRLGETTGVQVAYMSPAVSGMHDVFYRALKRHEAASKGGHK